MKFSVAAQEVRILITAIADAVSAAMGASGGLFFLGAVEAFAAGDGGGPGNAITDGQRLAVPIAFEAGPELLDAADGFVAENDGKIDLQFAFPEVDIGAADAGHFGADKCSSLFNVWNGKLAQSERVLELFKN
jgi:hypothetical protein